MQIVFPASTFNLLGLKFGQNNQGHIMWPSMKRIVFNLIVANIAYTSTNMNGKNLPKHEKLPENRKHDIK